jgi:hypothetical protein
MSLNHWQKTVLSLFIEIARIEPLIEKRINATRPAGLDENQFALLSHLAGVGEGGETLASFAWAMEGIGWDVDEELARAAAAGLITIANDRVTILPFGLNTQEAAVESLSPDFEQLLADMPIANLETARETLREIRRTLDNLPDR